MSVCDILTPSWICVDAINAHSIVSHMAYFGLRGNGYGRRCQPNETAIKVSVDMLCMLFQDEWREILDSLLMSAININPSISTNPHFINKIHL